MKNKISIKTKVLNCIRRCFKTPLIENIFVRLSSGKEPDSFIGKLLPSNYLYKKNSIRKVTRNGINFCLDISDLVDWFIYFNLNDDSNKKLFELCAKDSIVLDIGTNNGAVLLRLCKIANEGFVFGFEPDPYNYERSLINLGLNDCKNYKVLNTGLGEKIESGVIVVVDANNLGMNKILQDGSEGIKINLNTLNNFSKVNNLTKIDLIKIDTEGFEMKILKGGDNILKKFKPVLFIELDDDNLKEQGYSAKELINYLNDFYYVIKIAISGKIINENEDFTGCHYDIIAE